MFFFPGMFPNHIPNPEDKDAMAAIKKAVLEHDADLGIIFDTDVDRFGKSQAEDNNKTVTEFLLYLHLIHISLLYQCRAAAVDSNGKEMNRNGLIAVLSAIVLAEVESYSPV